MTDLTAAPRRPDVAGVRRRSSAGKIALRWEPSATLDVNLTADYTRERNETGVATLLYANAEGLYNGDPDRPWLTGTDGNAIQAYLAYLQDQKYQRVRGPK